MPPPAGSTSLFWSRAGCTLNSLVSWSFLPGFDTMFNEDTRAWVVQYDGYIVRQNKFGSWTKFCYTVYICKYIRIPLSSLSHNEKLHSLWVNIEINWCAVSCCGNNMTCHWFKCCLVRRYLGVCSYILNMLKEKDFLTLMGDGEWVIELALHLISSVLRLHPISQMNWAGLMLSAFPKYVFLCPTS